MGNACTGLVVVGMSEKMTCPFCGGEASIRIHDFYDGTRLYTPNCKCGAGIVKVFRTEEEAIAAWNTRAERTCHWIGIEEWKNPVECSECGVLVVAHVALDSNYCCNCGARVVER